MQDKWYLARCQTNCCSRGKLNLERQGFQVIQPLFDRTIIRSGRYIKRREAVFPSYLFVSESRHSPPITTASFTFGVARLVTFGMSPATVPANVIAELTEACDEAGLLTARTPLEIGSTVEVLDGTFATFLGKVDQLLPRERAIVLLEFMGEQRRITLNSSRLRPIGCM